MTGPERPRPVSGPPRPPVPGGVAGDGSVADGVTGTGSDALAGLGERPVSEHVAVLEAEHDRLQRRLATIDQL